MRLLLDSGADTEALTYGKRRPLHFAMQRNQYDVTRLLLESSVAVDAKSLGWTPLHVATGEKQQSTIRLLLDNGADVEAKNCSGMTALDIAITAHNVDIAMMLVLECCAKTEAKGSRGDTVFHLVAMLGQGTRMRSLMQLQAEPAAGIDSINHAMETQLHHAVDKGHKSMVRLLLEHCVKTEARTLYGNTALHLASGRDAALVETLIEFGADLEARNLQGMTALHRAVCERYGYHSSNTARKRSRHRHGECLRISNGSCSYL